MKITGATPKSAVLAELGRRLADYRKHLGLTQDELAAKAGIGVATLRRIEDGRDAQMGSWVKLLAAMGEHETLNAMLPENLRSPMAEVRKRKSPGHAVAEAGPVWGDEK